MADPARRMTGQELAKLPRDGRRFELLDGVLVELPPNDLDHDEIIGLVAFVFGEFVKSRNLGRFLAGNTGYYLRRNPDRVRAADLSFIVRERAPSRGQADYSDVLPDLVVEVVSTGDTAEELEERLQEWLNAGVRLVLVVYPTTRSVVAHRGPSDVRRYAYGDTLDAEPVLPGFSCPVSRLFPED